MSSLFEDLLPSIFRHRNPDPMESRFSDEEVAAAMEAAVQGVDPGICSVSGYRERLRPALESTLGYVNSMVETIPGVLEIDSRTFSTDPRVGAFFVDVNDLRSIFSRSSELRDFLGNGHSQGLERCCALLCMRKTERDVLGVALEGEKLRRDVKQVTVSFDDHQVLSPGADESEVRQGLKTCLFQSLITNTVGELSACQASVESMDAQRRSLNSRLRSLDQLAETDPERAAKMERVRARLADLSAAREDSRCLNPEHSLVRLLEVLEHPDRYVRLNSDRLMVNRLGVKVSPEQGVEPFDVAEVLLGNDNRRVVVLASFPLAEILPKPDLLANMSRYLQS